MATTAGRQTLTASRSLEPGAARTRSWRRPLRGPAWLACLLLVLVSAAPASAQDTTPREIARTLFERGQEKMANGEYREAVVAFAASNEQELALPTLLRLAEAHELLGELKTALETFERAAQLAEETGDASLERIARVRAAALGPRIPKLEVHLAEPHPAGLMLTLDGNSTSLDELARGLLLDPGAHELRVAAPGYQPLSQQLSMSRDSKPTVLRLPPLVANPMGGDETPTSGATDTRKSAAPPALAETSAPAVTATAPLPLDPAVARRRRLAWWVGGAGAVAAAASVVFTLIAANRKGKSVDEHCGAIAGDPSDNSNSCDRKGVDLRDDAYTYAHIATAAGVLGAAGIGGGLYLHVTADDQRMPIAATLGWTGSF